MLESESKILTHSTKRTFKVSKKWKETRRKKYKENLRGYFVYLPDDILDEWFQHLRRTITVRFTRANHFSTKQKFKHTRQ